MEKIEEQITPVVNDLGCNIVRISFIGGQKMKTLQVMIERADESPVRIEDCEAVSRAVSVSLDVIDPINERYNLEVSSTGIDRPLVKIADFIKFVGKYVIVKTYVLKNEKKIFKGLLESATENGIKLCLGDDVQEDGSNMIEFEYSEIKFAYLDGFKSL